MQSAFFALNFLYKSVQALQCDAESQEEAFTSCLNAGEVACYEAQVRMMLL